ncbi:DNA glycosylase, partial [Clavulina sp. PMI_390]
AHSSSRHSVEPVLECRQGLLDWFERVKHSRGMPWRGDYDPSLSPEDQTQRAYEVLVSEIMLQQTQVATVIPYYKKWMEAFPTIQSLAEADIEAVNQRWKGLGYYSRAARLLAAAKQVVNEMNSQFPSTSAEMQKGLPGVGRYTAGAVASIVFNEHTAAVDGNVQRLFSRLLALHAPLKGNKAKQGLEVVWNAAEELVQGVPVAGSLNQALIELGSTVCKPTNPACGSCPLRNSCSAYQLSRGSASSSVPDIEDICGLCDPFPDASTAVTRFPMKVEKKKAREEDSAVNVITWEGNDERMVLLVRRPEKGLLAGLYEFPTASIESSDKETLDAAIDNLTDTYLNLNDSSTGSGCMLSPSQPGSILHIFSHIRMTYHVR